MPERIQMTRQRPWRADHPDAVIVARPGRWGNPWRICPGRERGLRAVRHADGRYAGTTLVELAAGMAVHWYRHDVEHGHPAVPTVEEIRRELAGRDLACWCPLDLPCHGDVLLEIANGGAS